MKIIEMVNKENETTKVEVEMSEKPKEEKNEEGDSLETKTIIPIANEEKAETSAS